MNTDRFEELEMRLTFQEKTLSDLNDVIVQQQNEIHALKTNYNHLLERMTALADNSSLAQGDEVPPHY